MSGMRVGMDPELELKVRANNMAKIVGRLMQSLGTSADDAQSIMTRVSEQNVRKVEGFQYSSGKPVGYYEIEIDWEKSRMIVEGPDYKRTLPLNNSLRVEEQVKEQLKKIIEYFETRRRELRVDTVSVICTTSPGKTTPKGFRPLTKQELEELQNVRIRRGFRANPGEYGELGIGYFEL